MYKAVSPRSHRTLQDIVDGGLSDDVMHEIADVEVSFKVVGFCSIPDFWRHVILLSIVAYQGNLVPCPPARNGDRNIRPLNRVSCHWTNYYIAVSTVQKLYLPTMGCFTPGMAATRMKNATGTPGRLSTAKPHLECGCKLTGQGKRTMICVEVGAAYL